MSFNLQSSASLEYPCYRSTANIDMCTLTVVGHLVFILASTLHFELKA